MGIDETILKEMIKRILNVCRPERVILFGSAATGGMNKDSDIDVLILEASPENPRRESVVIGNALRGMGYPFDVIVMDAERF